jgi:Uma2 family endonuclease
MRFSGARSISTGRAGFRMTSCSSPRPPSGLSDDTYLEPDFVYYPKASGWQGLNAATARLVVEVSDSSLGYDLGRKAGFYAGFGITELWVIDAVKLETHIHREPAPEGYRSIRKFGAAETLVPLCASALAVTLAALDLR